ncbi:MAG: ornithine carbamoyltransferase [Dehalococcoidales bacterium]|nr:ornithine carbamoyltransferase [Dehalococcoidales bacterium]
MNKVSLKTGHFLSVTDVTPAELQALIVYAVELKAKGWTNLLKNKILAIMFEKPSLRTRVSFEVGMKQLGGQAIYLSPAEVGLGQRESVRDVSLVLSRFVNGIACRTFAQQNVIELAKYGSIPVINALSDAEHPCQALADLLTIYEHKGQFKGLTMAYIGDGFNVANSLVIACGMTGMNFTIASPDGYTLQPDYVKTAKKYAKASGAKITLVTDPREAAQKADILYTDAWYSMGQEAEAKIRRKAFAGYQINEKLLSYARKDAIIMHDLPAHHGEEIAEGILYAPQSVAFDQAENRLHAQKAVLAGLLG